MLEIEKKIRELIELEQSAKTKTCLRQIADELDDFIVLLYNEYSGLLWYMKYCEINNLPYTEMVETIKVTATSIPPSVFLAKEREDILSVFKRILGVNFKKSDDDETKKRKRLAYEIHVKELLRIVRQMENARSKITI